MTLGTRRGLPQAIREIYQNAYAKWTQEDDKRLEDEFYMGRDIVSLASLFGRRQGAIRAGLIRLGLIQ